MEYLPHLPSHAAKIFAQAKLICAPYFKVLERKQLMVAKMMMLFRWIRMAVTMGFV